MNFIRKYGIKENDTNIIYHNFEKPFDPSKVPGEIPLRDGEKLSPLEYHLLRRIKRHKEAMLGKYHFRI